MSRTKHDKLRFFAINGEGPYDCAHCGEQVEAPWAHTGPKSRELIVHHSGSKLVAMHRGCHAKHHALKNPGHRLRFGKKVRQLSFLPWLMRTPHRGPRPTEVRAKISAGMRAYHQEQGRVDHEAVVTDVTN